MGTLIAVDFKSDGTLFIKFRGCDVFIDNCNVSYPCLCYFGKGRVSSITIKDCVFVLEGTKLNCAVLLRLIKTIKASTYWSSGYSKL